MSTILSNKSSVSIVKSTKKAYLFLDFDGVLHPEMRGSCKLQYKKFLYPIVKKFNLDVVISSAWRTSYNLEQLQKLLGKRLGGHVIGKTPDHSLLPDSRTIEEIVECENPLFYGMRQREIEDWMAINANPEDIWIAIDDTKIHFNKNCENLFLTDGDIGLDRDVAKEFCAFSVNFLIKNMYF